LVSILPKTKELCSLEISPEGIAVACSSNSTNPKITTCSFTPCKDNSQIKQCLTGIVLKNNLKKMNCNLVLHPSQYRLTLVNTPNVPQIEYKNAIRWQIKDIINYPLEDAAVEVFYSDDLQKRPKKIYAIAAQRSFLQNTVNTIQECQLKPIAIDIHEFSIRNLITNLAPENGPIGFLDIDNTSCLLVIIQQNCIRFVRQIPVGLKQLKANNYSILTSELQRSFKYCSTELKQEIPIKFFMPPSMDIDAEITQNIAKNLDKEVSTLNLQKILHFTTPTSQETEMHCWAAVGGALRKDGKEQ
jgi:MSHA biogenesis protein MshI